MLILVSATGGGGDMRIRPTTPASQLHSSAGRYRWHCAAWELGLGYYRAVGPRKSSSTAPSDDISQVSPSAALARLEAVLLLAREPLGSRKLSQYANLADATEARTLIRHLNARYDRRGRAFRVVEVAGGYQLLTRPQLAAWLRRLNYSPAEVRLSAPALETLAVIAYRQPVGRADIEAIRGVNCGEIVRQLMDRDLVRIGGRSQELGRPYLYATTKHFLQIFGLSSLEDLPRAEMVRQAVIPQPRADSESRVVSPQLNPANDKASEEDHDVSVTTLAALTLEAELRSARRAAQPDAPQLAKDDDEDFVDDDDLDDDDDDDDDLDDDEDDLDDDDDDDDDLDDDLDEDEDDDLDDEEWEEVDDEDEDLDEEDDEDDDWDDDDDDEEDEEDWEDDEA